MRRSFGATRRALDEHWDVSGNELTYQFCQSIDDSISKTRRAIDSGVDIILVAGGDGTVNTIGRVVVGTDVAIGIIPAGSGNGFARHFGIPLYPPDAVASLAGASVKRIDVGYVNDHPFLVTCSMAWDASLIRSFEKMPVRGILPYIFAGVQEFFEYRAQAMELEIDHGQTVSYADPLVCTVANLTQYGGGARIAPNARPDDGQLELVVALKKDIHRLVPNIGRVFDGSIARIPEIISCRFKQLTVRREHRAPIQIDGELVDAPATIEVRVVPSCLNVLVPGSGDTG